MRPGSIHIVSPRATASWSWRITSTTRCPSVRWADSSTGSAFAASSSRSSTSAGARSTRSSLPLARPSTLDSRLFPRDHAHSLVPPRPPRPRQHGARERRARRRSRRAGVRPRRPLRERSERRPRALSVPPRKPGGAGRGAHRPRRPPGAPARARRPRAARAPARDRRLRGLCERRDRPLSGAPRPGSRRRDRGGGSATAPVPRRAPRRARRPHHRGRGPVHGLHALLPQVAGGREAGSRAAARRARVFGAFCSERSHGTREGLAFPSDPSPDPSTPKGGEREALALLARFLEGASAPIARYAGDRNRPDRAGTSRLSPHLHFGTISPRTVRAAAEAAWTGIAGPRRAAASRNSSSSWPGASSTTTSFFTSRASRRKASAASTTFCRGGRTPPASMRGSAARPAIRWSTPRCASSRRRTGCTTAPAWWRAPS